MDDDQKQSLLLRDQLAVDRTHMANERTLMAYLRTALMIFASGVTLIKISGHALWLEIGGWLLLPIALGMTIFSTIRFFRMRCRINDECEKLE